MASTVADLVAGMTVDVSTVDMSGLKSTIEAITQPTSITRYAVGLILDAAYANDGKGDAYGLRNIDGLRWLARHLGLPGDMVTAEVMAKAAFYGNVPECRSVEELRDEFRWKVWAETSCKVPSIRLDGKPVVSLSDLPVMVPDPAELQALEEELREWFDPDELAFLELTKMDGITREEAAEELDWTPQKVKAVQRRCQRNLNKLLVYKGLAVTAEKLTVSRASYRERLDSGHRAWRLRDP